MRWHYPLDIEFEIRALAVWGRERYLSATEAPHNNKSLRVTEGETFFSLNLEYQSGARTRDLRLYYKEAALNHYTRAPGGSETQL